MERQSFESELLMTEKKVLRIGLLGFGTVGSAFAEVLRAHNNPLVKITKVFNRNANRKKADHPSAIFVPADAVWTERVEEVLDASDVDCVVELMGGLDPVKGWLERALRNGKDVVTANKLLIGYYGKELSDLAENKHRLLLYGAAVAGGVPVIPSAAQGLCGDQITRITGIVNGTCNYILSSMEAGAEYSDVLKRAQKLGYAEADPSSDVDGTDAKAKLCILSRLTLRAEIDPDHVKAQTISNIAAVDFAYAKELGCTIRQISRAELVQTESSPNTVRASVGPMLVPMISPVGQLNGSHNMVITHGRFGGDVVFSGHGAGGPPTAVAVMSDVLAISEKISALRLSTTEMAVSGDVNAPYYLRFVVKDQPGIVAKIAGKLAQCGVNIDSILQRRDYGSERLPFVVTTDPCLKSKLMKAVDEMADMPFMLETPLCLQILVVDDQDTEKELATAALEAVSAVKTSVVHTPEYLQTVNPD